ncbi:Serine-type D-Ala-D-Ala carboxypeptidase [Saliniradius amylolyticus]|uniref:Serine-type D-Ala-D-Ala carboxypeptidase n=1 Tax=Saliniradius amylolyticus TaxID=2183582 RepID=A0A2S2E0L7_9ALTE|nr:serine hydrolase domain-containing protein [Saliniradius amylolyticus]AWL11166.1 Serine-type D-Ala-D-Ala carboxypeptidase [Saliniradius amylolyticus]
MRITRISLITLLVISLIFFFQQNQDPGTLKQRLQQSLDSHFPRLQVPGVSLALITPHQHEITLTRGVANVHTGEALQPYHRFRLASISKHLTSVLALKLIEQTPLMLSDSATDYVDLGPLPDSEAITVEQLMANTAGLYDYINGDNDFFSRALDNPNKRWTLNEILSYAVEAGPDFAPGSDYSYSNTGFYVLGEVLENATGQPLSQLFEQFIGKPTGVHHVFPDDFSNAGIPVLDLAENERAYEYHRDAIGAAGNFVGQPLELARLGHQIYNGNLLSPAHTQALLKPTPFNEAYGLGTRLWNDYGVVHYGHTGTLSGYKSILVHIESVGVTMVVAANGYAKEGEHWWDLVNTLILDVVGHYDANLIREDTAA